MDEVSLNIVAMFLINAFNPVIVEWGKARNWVDTYSRAASATLALVFYMGLWVAYGADQTKLVTYLTFAALAAGITIAGHTALRAGQRRRLTRKGRRQMGGVR